MDKITIFFSNRDDFLCIELSTLPMPCFAMLDAVRQRSSRVLECKLPDAFDGSKKLCGRFSQSFRVYGSVRDYPSVLASIFSIATISVRSEFACGSIDLSFGVFTNLEPDHIGPNEHASFEEYLACKAKLFSQCKTGIVNADPT